MSIRKAYNTWSSHYDSNKNRTRDMDGEITRQNLSELAFDTVLEIGCGTGKNTEFLVNKAQKITAVDFSEDMLAIAKEKIQQENVSFKQADITEKWTFTSEKFDLLTFNLVLEHIQDLHFIFDQASEKVHQNGFLYLSELHPFKQYAGTKARFENDGKLEELETYTHHVSEFVQAAERSGFVLLKIDEYFDETGTHIPRLLTLLFQKK